MKDICKTLKRQEMATLLLDLVLEADFGNFDESNSAAVLHYQVLI